MTQLKCTSSNRWTESFTVGRTYSTIESLSGGKHYVVYGDDKLQWYLDKNTLAFAGEPSVAKFEIVDNTQNGSEDTQSEYIPTKSKGDSSEITGFLCTYGHRDFTEGKTYIVVSEYSTDDYYTVYDDAGDMHEIGIVPDDSWKAMGDSSEFTPLTCVSTEEEEEEFRRIEQKQLPGTVLGEHVHIGWTQEETTAPQEPVDCSVAIAHHIHELQKWLKHIGCTGEDVLKISSEYIYVKSYGCSDYEAKEGGVGTLIEYLRIIGSTQKCLEKMEEI